MTLLASRLKLLSALSVLAAVLFAQRASSTSFRGAVTCQLLASTLGTLIVQSSGAKYIATATVFPRTASHVQTTMKFIYATGAHYAVQAGSHSGMKGWNTVQQGVLINFSDMKNVSYDAEKDTIILEPGTLWGDAISALEPKGVAPVGGRQSDVGTGLMLGGGLSFLSPAHGFAADSFKELDVVLVSGKLVTATATNEYADLFRALKGGANRFGIVTRYELYAVHTGTKEHKNWFGGSLLYANSSVEVVLRATAHYVSNVKDPNAVFLSSLVNLFTAGVLTPLIAVNVFYNGTELPEAIFGEILSIPTISRSLGPMSYFDMTNTLPAGGDRGSGQYFGASALVGDEGLYLDALYHWTNFSNSFKDSGLTYTVLAFTPVLDPQIQAGRARGGNAISPPLGGYAAVQIAQQFTLGVRAVPEDLDRGIDLLLSQIPRSPGLPLLMNECNAKQNVFATYDDYEQLRRTYAKYDPTKFNVKHTDGPRGL